MAGSTSTDVVPCPNGAPSRLSGSAIGLLAIGGMAFVSVWSELGERGTNSSIGFVAGSDLRI
jgi:hypothetical protein